MDFYSRYTALCAEKGLSVQSQKMLDITQVSSPSITGWKKGSIPRGDVLCRLSKFFNVTTDYLLGLSELRTQCVELEPQEMILLKAYKAADLEGKNEIIWVCRNELKKAEERRVKEEGPVSG